MVGSAKPGIGGERLPFQESLPNNSVIPRGNGPNLPAWVAFDKQVLSFDAYFMEAVTERADEQFRVHKCKVLFYLEDDSMQIVEPKGQNAGIPQGLSFSELSPNCFTLTFLFDYLFPKCLNCVSHRQITGEPGAGLRGAEGVDNWRELYVISKKHTQSLKHTLCGR